MQRTRRVSTKSLVFAKRFHELRVSSAQDKTIPSELDGPRSTRETPRCANATRRKEFHAGPIGTDTFVGTPPLLALRLFTGIAASARRGRYRFWRCMKTHEPGELHVQPLLSVSAPDRCWNLLKSMPELGDQSNLAKEQEVAESHGYRRFECCPCIWTHDGLNIYVLVRRDDFHIMSGRTGIEKSQEHCGKALRSKYTLFVGQAQVVPMRREHSTHASE